MRYIGFRVHVRACVCVSWRFLTCVSEPWLVCVSCVSRVWRSCGYTYVPFLFNYLLLLNNLCRLSFVYCVARTRPRISLVRTVFFFGFNGFFVFFLFVVCLTLELSIEILATLSLLLANWRLWIYITRIMVRVDSFAVSMVKIHRVDIFEEIWIFLLLFL